MFCSNCGQPIENGATFCPHCGTAVEDTAPAGGHSSVNGQAGRPGAATSNYKCPKCGSALSWDPGAESVRCAHCGTTFTMEAVEACYEDAAEAEDTFSWQDYKTGIDANDRLENTVEYICESCGAHLECDANTAAISCPYCGSNVVINERIEGGLRPNAVIPFRITPEQLPDVIHAFYKDKKLLPKDFFSDHQLSQVQGIYVPFWLFRSGVGGTMTAKATRVRHYRQGNYDCTETQYFRLVRGGDMEFANVPVDASTRMDNDLMDSLEPFDFSELVDFKPAYLTGYLADRFDSDPDSELGRAGERMRSSAKAQLSSTCAGYSSVSNEQYSLQLEDPDVKYVFLPVYLLNCEYNGQKYRYAVNGQTGKVVGDLPISKERKNAFFWKTFGIAAAIGGALAALLQLL